MNKKEQAIIDEVYTDLKRLKKKGKLCDYARGELNLIRRLKAKKYWAVDKKEIIGDDVK